MPYIISEEEGELDLDLLQHLAEALRKEIPDLAHADATYRIRSARGLLQVEGREAADRLSVRFRELGFGCFVMEKLLELPPAAHLNPEKPELGEAVELAVAARLDLVTEKRVTTTHRRLSLPMTLAGVPMTVKKTEETTTRDSDTRYCLDLFTATQRRRARPGNPMVVRVVLLAVARPEAVLSPGAREVMQGERCTARFAQESEYERYVTWLYQVRYGRGADG